jgi:hypothetical protein
MIFYLLLTALFISPARMRAREPALAHGSGAAD